MKKHQEILNSQGGFTLIEIIAVLVILGILAAVAVPKFMNMQDEARKKTVQGALSAGASNATMAYSKFLMDNGSAPTKIDGNSWKNASKKVAIETDLGDFTAAYTYDSTKKSVTVTISAKTGSNTDWVTSLAATDKVKTFNIQS